MQVAVLGGYHAKFLKKFLVISALKLVYW